MTNPFFLCGAVGIWAGLSALPYKGILTGGCSGPRLTQLVSCFVSWKSDWGRPKTSVTGANLTAERGGAGVDTGA